MSVTHIFFDVGGVLGTNGWDSEQRAAAARQFGLDAAEFAERHEEAVSTWETGGMTIAEYLQCTVFHRPRAFSVEDFKAFMFAQSAAFPQSIDVARALAQTGRYLLMTINNESAELNAYRLRHFGLLEIFVAFFSSCWVGALKPARRIYERALAMAQAEPSRSIFIDDRARNLDVPRMLGVQTILYRGAPQLREDLVALGVNL